MQFNIIKSINIGLWIGSIIFFILALFYPILYSEVLMGLNIEQIFFFDSISFFFEAGDYFIGGIILCFSFIFPIIKYIIIGGKIFNLFAYKNKLVIFLLDLLSKWAMLDVFVIALLIVNMKFTSSLITTRLNIGTNYFAISIILMLICNSLLQYETSVKEKDKFKL